MSTPDQRKSFGPCKSRTFHDALETVSDDFVTCVGRQAEEHKPVEKKTKDNFFFPKKRQNRE